MTPEPVPWAWRLIDHSGGVAEQEVAGAESRFEAEQWLGGCWRELAGRGVERAVLLRAGEQVGAEVELREHRFRTGTPRA